MAQASRVTGTDEVAAAFDELAKRSGDATEVGRQLAAIGVDAAKRAAPVASGALVASIGVDEVGQTTADLGTEVGYAPFPEFGTAYIEPVRFMLAGYEAMTERAEAIATEWMSGVLGDVDAMA